MINPDTVRVPVSYDPAMWYVGMVGIGTFSDRSFIDYLLLVDSASDMTWVQCKGATHIFYQEVPLYPWEDSKTYRPLPCEDHSILCPGDKCNKEGECTYEAKYSDGGSSSGVIAQETFTIFSSAGGLESVQILMGCGFNQANFVDFGMNHLKKSLILLQEYLVWEEDIVFSKTARWS
ncbi:aspartic proteinase nepenthesin-2-like [Papaver somniferum]|uniref:aspartic proteinase nepenthesin-2-like n=1 Tax=Papaver somniferum TaxID=3469 RepID=UPI000E6FD0A0|nr:aspartic proteinase nepenthesin-2-like [Papaver somniferum]